MIRNPGPRTVLLATTTLLIICGASYWGLPFSQAVSALPSPTGSHGLSLGDPGGQDSQDAIGTTQAAPSAEPSLFPPRSPAIPTESPTVSPSVSPSDAKKLLRQFTKSQDSEMAALKHRQKAELGEMKAAHKAQLSEWEAKEREARHKYFAEHKSGPDRRAYIQDYEHRREILLKIQSDDEDKRSHDQSVRLDSLKSDQAEKLKEFQDYLSRGERPPANFWPN